MDCDLYPLTCKLDAIAEALKSGPSDLDIASFFVMLLAAIASTATAIVAIVLSIRATQDSTKLVREAARAESRRRRVELAHDMSMWFSDGTPFMIVDLEVGDDFADWVARGESLLFRARNFEEPGAGDLMAAAKTLRELIKTMQSPEHRLNAALHSTKMFKMAAGLWVRDPESAKSIAPASWLDESWFEPVPDEETAKPKFKERFSPREGVDAAPKN